jgi:hypothetical protein
MVKIPQPFNTRMNQLAGHASETHKRYIFNKEKSVFNVIRMVQAADGGLPQKAGINFFFVGWDLRHQVLRPLLAYCTAPDDR